MYVSTYSVLVRSMHYCFFRAVIGAWDGITEPAVELTCFACTSRMVVERGWAVLAWRSPLEHQDRRQLTMYVHTSIAVLEGPSRIQCDGSHHPAWYDDVA